MNELLTGRAYVSNDAINASYDYTANEIDLLVKIIFFLSKETDSTKRSNLRLSYSQLQPENIAGSDYAEIRQAFKGLIMRPLEIFYKETKQYFISSLVSSVTIQKRSGIIDVFIHPKMCEIMMDIRREFTSIEIQTVLKLRSKYAKRIYLMLCQFKATGIRYLNIDELRAQLKLNGKYDKVADIRRRIIEPAIFEINQVSELIVQYEINRNSRKIEDLVFTIKLKEQSAETVGDEKQRVFMQRMGLSEFQIVNAVNSLRPEELHLILYNFNLRKEKVANKGAYLATMLHQAGVNMKQKLHFQQPLPL